MTARRDGKTSATAFIAVITAGLLVRLPLLALPLTYSSDAWREADTASIAYHFFKNGFRLFYPQVFWGGGGPGFVETEFQLFPFLTSLLYFFSGERLWMGQAVSLLFSIATWVVFARLASTLLDRNASLIALFVFVVAPISIRYSVAFMPEATVLFFYVVALTAFTVYLKSGQKRLLWLSATMTSLAILVKPTSIHLLMVLALLVLMEDGARGLRKSSLWFAGIASLIPGVLWFSHARTLYLTYGNTFGLISGGDSKFGSITDWINPQFYWSLLRLDVVWVFAGVSVLLFALGIWKSIRERKAHAILAGSLSILLYYMLVARYSKEPWGIQYHIFFLPFASLGVGLGLHSLIARLESAAAKRAVLGSFAVLTILFSGYCYRSMLLSPGHGFTDELVRFAAAVAANTAPDDRIIVTTSSTSVDGKVENNYQEPIIFFYAKRYGWSLPADQRSPERLDTLRMAGAKYVVVHDKRLLQSDSQFASYLVRTAQEVVVPNEVCGKIYRFPAYGPGVSWR